MAKKKEVKKKTVRGKKAVKKIEVKRCLTLSEIKEALKDNHGFISKTAESLKVAYVTVSRRVNANKNLKELSDKYKALYHTRIYEKAKNNVFDKVMSGDLRTSKYILEKLGRSEGFGNSQEINIGANKGLEDINLKVTFVDAGCRPTDADQTQTIFRKKKTV